MTLAQLIEAYNNGTFNIKYEKGSDVGEVSGMMINTQQAASICTSVGWTEWVLHPFEILTKTGKFVKSIKSNVKDEDILNNVRVEFQNKNSPQYMKTADRIHMVRTRGLDVSIMYGLASAGASYVIYNNATSVPMRRCKSMKQVCMFINEKM